MWVVLQHCVCSSILRLQSQQFVACFSSNKAKLTKLSSVLVPDFQSALTYFEQSLILATDRCIDGELRAHPLLPSLRLLHFVASKRKPRIWGSLQLKTASRSLGPSTQKGTVSFFLPVLSTRFAIQVSPPVVPSDCSTRLNLQLISKSKASLERNLPF